MTGNAQNGLETLLAELTSRLQGAFGESLVSLVLYGSAAAGDWNEKTSDINVLCVLDRLTHQELAASVAAFRWWTTKGNPQPLLLSASEVGSSTDCFPMEFHDMRENRRVLFGTDPIQNLRVENLYYRAQVEHELRSKQIRLRQKAAQALSDAAALQNLLVQSISTFCVVARHALLLADKPAGKKKTEIVTALEQALGRPLGAFHEILAMRENQKSTEVSTGLVLLDRYLEEIGAIVKFVDGLEKRNT